MASIAYLLKVRKEAERLGDAGLYRAMTADLARLGYKEPEASLETADYQPPEQAIPKSRGRAKLPRCEHDRIVGRCVECEED